MFLESLIQVLRGADVMMPIFEEKNVYVVYTRSVAPLRSAGYRRSHRNLCLLFVKSGQSFAGHTSRSAYDRTWFGLPREALPLWKKNPQQTSLC